MHSFENSDQVKSFLKKESKRLNLSINNTYNTFFSRLLLERVSKYNGQEIIVKGSFAQMVHLRRMVRPVTDVDITSRGEHSGSMVTLINAMVGEATDNIKYEIRSQIHRTQTGIYKIPIDACLGKICHPIGIDYRELHPCIYEIEEKNVIPIFEGDEEYPVLVPSIEETLAEKLCIIVESCKSDVLNTRVKDFYDIYQLHGGNYDLDKFSYYFEKMLDARGKILVSNASTNHLTEKFVEEHRSVWEHSKEKYEFLDHDISLEGAVYYTRGVLSEQLQKIRQGKNKVYALK